MASKEQLSELEEKNSSFLENSTKWAITWISQRFSASLPYRNISLSDLKTIIQFPFSHMEHLVARAQHPARVEDVKMQIFT